MSDLSTEAISAPDGVRINQLGAAARMPPAAHYGLSLLLVALATAAGFVLHDRTSSQNITLIYVLPVIASASWFGWGPALLAVLAGVIAFDYFFTVPYYSLTITDPAEIWSAVLLLIIGTVVASVSAQSRRRGLEAIEAAERAEALHGLAHAIIHRRSQQEILQIGATTLHQIFSGPAIILLRQGTILEVVAASGGARGSEADREAAQAALSSGVNTRGEIYPSEQTYFDFWPVFTSEGHGFVLGVDFAHAARERPASSERLVESVAGYISVALDRDNRAGLPEDKPVL